MGVVFGMKNELKLRCQQSLFFNTRLSENLPVFVRVPLVFCQRYMVPLALFPNSYLALSYKYRTYTFYPVRWDTQKGDISGVFVQKVSKLLLGGDIFLCVCVSHLLCPSKKKGGTFSIEISDY